MISRIIHPIGLRRLSRYWSGKQFGLALLVGLQLTDEVPKGYILVAATILLFHHCLE